MSYPKALHSSNMWPLRPLKRQAEHQTPAASDLWQALRQEVEHRWIFVILALGIPSFLLGAFLMQYDRKADYKPPDVVYFQDWRSDRSDAEVKRQQNVDAPVERAQRAELKRLQEEKKAKFRKLADQLGIDVDKQR